VLARGGEQPRLAHPLVADDRHRAPAPGRRVVQRRDEGGELALALDHARPRHRISLRGDRHRCRV
jgi:hypothetical protein